MRGLLLLVCLSATLSGQSVPPSSSPIIGDGDYVYSYWPVNYRPWATWGTNAKVRYVNTGHYGLAFDTASGQVTRLGALPVATGGAEGALGLDNSVVDALPTLSVSHSVMVSEVWHVADSFLGPGGDANTPSRLIDGGRFMQRVDIPEVSYSTAPQASGSVQLATMPRHFVLTHRTQSTMNGVRGFGARIEISGLAAQGLTEVTVLERDRAIRFADAAGDGWVFVLPAVPGKIARIEQHGGGVRFSSFVKRSVAGQQEAVSVIALPAAGLSQAQLDVYLNPGATVAVQYAQRDRNGQQVEPLVNATFDPERGAYVVDLRLSTNVGAPTWPDWSNPLYQTWYNRHRVVLNTGLEESVSIPVALELGATPVAGITGGCAMFRDQQGRPLGVPVQISKNWHEVTATPRHWYHFYSQPLLPDGGTHELEFTIAHAKWGSTFTASHAQLCLIGWGVNQQWHESALGCWGESVTYDPDMTLQRSMVDDVRPFLVQSANTYNWTGNVGGADFLVYRPTGAAPDRLGRLRTLLASPGPNLTDAHFAGVTADGKIEAHIRARLGRTDDLVRVFYDLEYTFHQSVTYDRLAFFQVAADNYSDNGFSRLAYGNATATISDQPMNPTGAVGYASSSDRGIPLTGPSPWVMLYQNTYTGGNLPEHRADVGFVVRRYELDMNGAVTQTPHINLVHTNNWGQHPQVGFELGIPYDPASPVVPAGTTLRATVEYLVPPSLKSVYYGPSADLLAVPASEFGTPTLMRTLAAGNDTTVNMTTGTLLREHPIEIEVASGDLAAEFQLTGGFGFVPIVFSGLARHHGWRLERLTTSGWAALGQEVEGNDFWQARFDAERWRYELVFNVDNTGTTSYRLIR